MEWLKRFGFIITLALFAGTAPPSKAMAQNLPELRTNQQYIEKISKKTDLRIDDLENVFDFVFGSLPDTVKVYPTENYYYFSFYQGGIKFAGNLRLDAFDRDKGILHFAYFNAFTRWNEETTNQYKSLSAKDGVIIKKLTGLSYRITYKKKSVIFRLNDLSAIAPPATMTHKGEEYLGPVYDESGLQFFLVYNAAAKVSTLSSMIWTLYRSSFLFRAQVRILSSAPGRDLRFIATGCSTAKSSLVSMKAIRW